MRINHELYDHDDRNSYFTGGICEYDKGKYGWVNEVYDSGDAVIRRPNESDIIRDFDSLSFPKPQTGLYQNGLWCEMLTLEPVRQWRKVFRTTQYTVSVPSVRRVIISGADLEDPNNIMDESRLKSIFSKREYPSTQEAYELLKNGDIHSQALSRHLYAVRNGTSIMVCTGLDSEISVGTLLKSGKVRVRNERYLALVSRIAEVICQPQ